MPKSPLLRGPIIAALACALVLLGGCSTLRLAYGQADSFAFRWLDGYADFDNAQSLRVRGALADWFAWNRKTQLPDYADLLLRLDAEVLADTSAERVCAWWAEGKARFDRGLDQAVPAFAEVALTLRPAQLENIERRNAKSNAEYRDEYLQQDASRRSRETVKRIASRAEWLYGDIDRSQRDRIARWLAEAPSDPNLAFDERVRRQQDGLQTLRRLSGAPIQPSVAEGEVRSLFRRTETSPREPYRIAAERALQNNCRLAADLHNSTSAAQRQVASKKLRGWAADLRSLAADAGG